MLFKPNKKILNLLNHIINYKMLIKLLDNQKYRFLLVGVYNFIFNYLVGLIIFKIFVLNILSFSLFYVFSILHNFITHKFFSFRKKFFCIIEGIRGLITYSLMYVFSTIFLWFLLKNGLSQLTAYHLNILVSLIFFYILHSQFTFKVKL